MCVTRAAAAAKGRKAQLPLSARHALPASTSTVEQPEEMVEVVMDLAKVGDAGLTLGGAASSLGGAESSLGDAESSLGDDKSSSGLR
jgi:hypothetical protein